MSSRVFGLILSVFLLADLLAAGYGLWSAQLTTTPPANPGLKTWLARERERDGHITFTLTVRNLALSDDVATADVTVTLPIFLALDPHYPTARMYPTLIDGRTHHSIFDCSPPRFDQIYCHLSKRYRTSVLAVELGVSDRLGLGPKYNLIGTIPLRDLYGRLSPRDELTIYREYHWQEQLPVSGSDDAFPNDRYAVNIGVGLLSDNLVILSKPFERRIDEFAPGCAHDPIAWSNSGLNEIYRVEPSSLPNTLAFSCHVSPVSKDFVYQYHITFARNSGIALYTYAVAALPLLFFLVFAHMLFFNPSYKRTELRDFLVALIVAILAVLPLRSVLVPSEVTGITRVDIVLGVGLILIGATGIGRYAYDVIRPQHVVETEDAWQENLLAVGHKIEAAIHDAHEDTERRLERIEHTVTEGRSHAGNWVRRLRQVLQRR